jgi:hypothetical protein
MANCLFSIKAGDVINEINDTPISEWPINDLPDFVCTTVIKSIKTESYKEYAYKKSLNFKMAESLRLNGFNVYRMQHNTNIIRIKEISTVCVHQLDEGDKIIHVNNILIENWTFDSLCSHLAQNIIASIETTKYKRAITHVGAITHVNENENRNSANSTVKQEWDYDNPCMHCGCIHLKKSNSFRIKCCRNGKFVQSPDYPHLSPLPPKLKEFSTEVINHFARNSVSYNNVLALGNLFMNISYTKLNDMCCSGALGIDNEDNSSGWEHMFGDHSVKLHGRTYHYLTNAGGHKSSGLKYFCFDAVDAMRQHGSSLNSVQNDRCNIQILTEIFNELKSCNKIVQECSQIGWFAETNRAMYSQQPLCQEVIIQINEQTSHLDVAAITADNITGNAIISFVPKGQATCCSIPCYSHLQEPLLYPLLFTGMPPI